MHALSLHYIKLTLYYTNIINIWITTNHRTIKVDTKNNTVNKIIKVTTLHCTHIQGLLSGTYYQWLCRDSLDCPLKCIVSVRKQWIYHSKDQIYQFLAVFLSMIISSVICWNKVSKHHRHNCSMLDLLIFLPLLIVPNDLKT